MSETKLSRAAPICDRDCFNCKFADCIREDLTAADYDDARALEAFIHPPTPAKRRIAAKQKAYREENREAIAAKQKARALAEFRREHGMTQARLGRILGVSQPTISLWESGAVPFDLEAMLLKAGCCV